MSSSSSSTAMPQQQQQQQQQQQSSTTSPSTAAAPVSDEQQQQLPPTSVQDEAKRWTCVWATYLNSTKTTAQGRKVAKVLAVPEPHFKEIVMACQVLGLSSAVERKSYSRDF